MASEGDRPALGESKRNYKYEQLETGNVRILKLLPAMNKTDELCGELQPYKLSTDLEFEALSYVWGEPIFPVSLRIGQSYINITDNLSSALRKFRKSSAPRALWVDAVCIDQGNGAEKNTQVPLMGQVYRRAKTVLAWLGELPHAQIDKGKIDLAGAIAFFGRGIPAVRPNTSGYLINDLGKMIMEAGRDEGGRWSKTWSVCNLDEQLNPGGVRALYESDWFTRVWIVQEAVLAQSLVLHYGAGSLDWWIFERVCVLIFLFAETSHAFVLDAWKTFSTNCWRLVRVMHDLRHYPHVKMAFKAMHTLGSHSCREDVDRVYGFLGFLPEDSGLSLKVDYAKHPFTVYSEAAALALRSTAMDILYSAGAWRRSDWSVASFNDIRSPGYLPTWVPQYNANFTFHQQTEVTWWMQNGFGDHALTDVKGAWSFAHNELHCISVRGSLIGKVIGSWDSNDLKIAKKGDASLSDTSAEYHETRAMCLQLLQHIRERLSLSNDWSWKVSVLRVMLACIDTNAWWKAMGALYDIDTEVIPVYLGLSTYYRSLLADDGEIHLSRTQSQEPKSGNTAISDLVGDLKKLELAGVTRAKRKDRIDEIQMRKNVQQLMMWFHGCIRTALRNFTVFAIYGEEAHGVRFSITPSSSAGVDLADDVTFIDCCKVPFVLRRAQDGHFLISPCYMWGIDLDDPDARQAVGRRSLYHLI